MISKSKVFSQIYVERILTLSQGLLVSLLHELSKAFEDFFIVCNKFLSLLVDPTLEKMVTTLLDLKVLGLVLPAEVLWFEFFASFDLLPLYFAKVDVTEPGVL